MKCEFSLDHYLECLQLAQDKRYQIITVRDTGYKYRLIGSDKIHTLQDDKKVIVLRHDIDFFLEYAYNFAMLEYDIGVRSTYFILLHSWGYNALAPQSMELIRYIHSLGHEIGLHYDPRYDIKHEDFILHAITGTPTKSMSLHLPGISDKDYVNKEAVEEYGYYLINPLKLTEYKYLSDSGHNWREGCMCNWIGKEKKDKLHILVHPIWWVDNKPNIDLSLSELHLDLYKKVDKDFFNIKSLLEDYKKTI